MNCVAREWIESDRPQQCNVDPTLFCKLDSLLADPGDEAECDKHYFRFIFSDEFVPDIFLHLSVFVLKPDIDLFHFLRLQVKRCEDSSFAIFRFACGCPRLRSERERSFGRKQNFLHHLAKGAVGKDHCGIAVLVCKAKSLKHKIRHFLHRGRGENKKTIISMAPSFRCLKIIPLRRLNGAESRSAALHIDDETWNFSRRHIRNSFLH